jgi:hypothetical protein
MKYQCSKHQICDVNCPKDDTICPWCELEKEKLKYKNLEDIVLQIYQKSQLNISGFAREVTDICKKAINKNK